MARKTEDLTLLTNSEISKRLQKIFNRVIMTFAILAPVSILAANIGLQLSSVGNTVGAVTVSLSAALLVVIAAFYLRHLARQNDSLLIASKNRRD
jgi:hypothetical protein